MKFFRKKNFSYICNVIKKTRCLNMGKIYASAIVEHYHMGGTKETCIHASLEINEYLKDDKEHIRDLYEDRIKMFLDVLTIKLFTIESKRDYNKGMIKFG